MRCEAETLPRRRRVDRVNATIYRYYRFAGAVIVIGLVIAAFVGGPA